MHRDPLSEMRVFQFQLLDEVKGVILLGHVGSCPHLVLSRPFDTGCDLVSRKDSKDALGVELVRLISLPGSTRFEVDERSERDLLALELLTMKFTPSAASRRHVVAVARMSWLLRSARKFLDGFPGRA